MVEGQFVEERKRKRRSDVINGVKGSENNKIEVEIQLHS